MLDSGKVLFRFARGKERCDCNGHAVFLPSGADFAAEGLEITGISTSSMKLKQIFIFCTHGFLR